MRVGIVMIIAMMAGAPGAGADAALDSMVANERAFAALASAKGTRTAFLTYLAEGSVVFEPIAYDGRKTWEAKPELKGNLLWEPAYAQVSSAGDMGFTTGPWEFRPPADSSGTPPTLDHYAYGQFNSIWKKVGSQWRVLLDIGVRHPRPSRSGVGSGEFEAAPALPRKTMKSGRTKMTSLDEKLTRDMRQHGVAAFSAHAAENVRMNTDGLLPARGLGAAQARVDSLIGFLDFKPEGSGVASSGDLGYTYGKAVRYPTAEAQPADTSMYVHVWRQSGNDWRLALVVWNKLGAR